MYIKNNMNYRNLLILISILFLSFSCDKDDIEEQISFEIIEEGNMSYSDLDKISKQYLVFKDNIEWIEFIPEIEKIHPSTADKFRDLEFDFENYDLAIVIGEFYNYCCSEITIEKVYLENREIKIDFSENGPGGFAALSQAYIILKIKAD